MKASTYLCILVAGVLLLLGATEEKSHWEGSRAPHALIPSAQPISNETPTQLSSDPSLSSAKDILDSKALPSDEPMGPEKLTLPPRLSRFLELSRIPLKNSDDEGQFHNLQTSEFLVQDCLDILLDSSSKPSTYESVIKRIVAIQALEKAGTKRSHGTRALEQVARQYLNDSESGLSLLEQKSRRGDLLELAHLLFRENPKVITQFSHDFHASEKWKWLRKNLSL